MLNVYTLIYVGLSFSKEWFISIAGKQLSEEIQRLKNLQGEGLFCNLREDHTKYREPNTSGSSQVESGILNDSDVNVRRKRSRHYGTTAEITGTLCTDDQLEHTPVRESDLSKQIVSSETGLVIDEVYMISIFLHVTIRTYRFLLLLHIFLSFLTIVWTLSSPSVVDERLACQVCIQEHYFLLSYWTLLLWFSLFVSTKILGGGADITGPPNCMFQDLIECLIGMKLSTVAQTDGICISAVHQSSGNS